MLLKRLRLPAMLVVMAGIGSGAGLALAQEPGSSPDQIEATAEEIDCASFDMTAQQERQIEDCWNTELTSSPPPDATEADIALAEQAALCDAVDEGGVRPDFCVISDEADGS
jgi:hypothetical protein